MFDIGFGEIFLIAVVALLVLGPERLPKAARFTGLWVRRARAQWYSVKAELENELADEELKRSLKQTHSELMEARDSLAQGGEALKQQLEAARADVNDALRDGSAGDGQVARDGSDEDLEPPLSSVADAIEQPELPLDDHFPAPGDDAETVRSTGAGHDARR
jgi:sec-independent protein translocase protein TatB